MNNEPNHNIYFEEIDDSEDNFWWIHNEDDTYEEDFDCAWNGEYCELAGTEDCDFDCPYHDFNYGIKEQESNEATTSTNATTN